MRSSEHLGDQFVFLSDPEGKLVKHYSGIEHAYETFNPGTYVVGKDGKIAYSFTNISYTVRAPVEDVLAAVRKVVG